MLFVCFFSFLLLLGVNWYYKIASFTGILFGKLYWARSRTRKKFVFLATQSQIGGGPFQTEHNTFSVGTHFLRIKNITFGTNINTHGSD